MQNYLAIPADLPRRNPVRLAVIMGLTVLVYLMHSRI
jgi:hypothetical protein